MNAITHRQSRAAAGVVVLAAMGWTTNGWSMQAVSNTLNPPQTGSQHAPLSRVAATPSTRRQLTAVTRARQAVTLAVPLDGVLASIDVEEGAYVSADQVLARMDSALVEAELDVVALEAQRQGPTMLAQAALTLAKQRLDRVRQSHEKGGATEIELFEATGEHERRLAELMIAQEAKAVAAAKLKIEQAAYERHLVRAPFEGVVTRVEAEPGTTMIQGQPVLQLIATQVLTAEVNLPLDYYRLLQAGRDYHFDAQAPVERRIQATLMYIDPAINAASGTFRCVFEIANDDRELPAGFVVTLGVTADGMIAEAPSRSPKHATVPGDD